MYQKLFLILLVGLLCCLSAGCQLDLPKTVAETDASVYEVIDSQWDDELTAERANYRIADAATDAKTIVADEPTLSKSDVLTLPAAVAIATRHNRQYHTEKETLYLTALDYTDVRHLYEPMPFMGGDGGFRKDDGNKAAGAFGNVGFEQLLATGAHISGNLSLGWVDIISGDFRSGFSTVASTVITQPLLRGAGRKVALENLTQAERNTLYQIRSFNRYRKTFVTSIMTEYYTLLQLNTEQLNARDYYYSLYKIYEKLQKRAASGRLPQHELEQANQDRLQALADYTSAKKDYNNALDEFKMQLAFSVSRNVRLNVAELDALKRSATEMMAMSEEDAIGIALAQRLDLANAADQVIDAERKVDVAADAIRAELNLIGAAETQTPNRTVFGADPGQLQETRDRYQLSAQLDLPIDRLAEKNAYRRSLITLMQQQRAHQELTEMVTLEVRRAYRQMQEAYRRWRVEQTSRELASERTDNTLLLLRYDRANTRDVLDAREDLLDAQNASNRALIDYVLASLEFYRDTGSMKIRPDGMWEKPVLTVAE